MVTASRRTTVTNDEKRSFQRTKVVSARSCIVKSITWLSHGCHVVVETYGITACAVNSGNIDAYVVAVDRV